MTDAAGSDHAGFGTILVLNEGRSMRIGSGLNADEADLVARLVREAAQQARPG